MTNWQDNLPPKVKERLAQIEKAETREKEAYSGAGLSQEAFVQAVRERVERGKLSFIPAVYQVFGDFFARELAAAGITLACKKGCCVCCKSVLLTCTEAEIDTVIRFINSLPREKRIPLMRRIRASISEWREYYEKHQSVLEKDSFQAFRDWRKPCAFLDEAGECGIYPVRIIDCRNYTSLITCSPGMSPQIPCDLHHPGPGRFRFQAEKWANNLILEEEAKRTGLPDPRLVSVVIIYHWLLLKKREWK